MIRLTLIATATLIFSMGAWADNEPAPARQILADLLTAVASQDYERFIGQGTDEFQASIPETQFGRVTAVMAERIDQGYQAQYLTHLNQQGYRVDIWKISFADDGDDTLARLVVVEGKAAGFLLQ